MAAFGGFLTIVAVIVIAGILIAIFHKLFKVYYWGFKGIALEIIIALIASAAIVGFLMRGISNIGNTVKDTFTGTSQTVSETIWDDYSETGYYLKTNSEYPCILMITPQEGTSKKTLEFYFRTTVEADSNSGFSCYGYPDAGDETLILEDGNTTLTPAADEGLYVDHADNSVYSGDYVKVDLATYYDTLYDQIYPANTVYEEESNNNGVETLPPYVSIHGLDYSSFTGDYSSDQAKDVPTYSSIITITQIDDEYFSFELHMTYTDTYYNTSTSYDYPATIIPYSEIDNDAFTVSDGNVTFRVNFREGMSSETGDNYIYIDNTEIIDNPDNWWFGGSYYPYVFQEPEQTEPEQVELEQAEPEQTETLLPIELTWDGTYICNNGGSDGVKTVTISKIDDLSISFSMEHTYGDGRTDAFSATANIGTYNRGQYFASYEQEKTLFFHIKPRC